MKKVLTIAALLGVASLSYGQGTVNFAAGASPATRIATNSAIGGASTGIISGGGYYFALFVAPTSVGTSWGSSTSWDPTIAGFSLVNGGEYATNSNAGRFTGTSPVTVNGFPTSSSGEFVVVGWSANIAGASWASFQSWINGTSGNGVNTGWAGHSLVADAVQLGGGAIPAGNIFGANTGQVPGFTLGMVTIPEPTTFALAGLGAAALVIFRRRKA
jgi:PEP-CTERM motif-containing protein